MNRALSYAAVCLLLIGVTLGAQQPAPALAQPPRPVTPAAPPAPSTGQPPVTFRVEINHVEVDALVTDDKGNAVSDLGQSDFTILEDGKPQKIATFAHVRIPIEQAEQPLYKSSVGGRPVEPDVQTNAGGFDGRVYVILLDDLHTAALRSNLVKNAARKFIEQHMGVNDMAAVLHTSGRPDASQDFTANRRLLLASVDRFVGKKLRSQTMEQIDDYNRQLEQETANDDPRLQGGRDSLDFERGYYAKQALGTLKQVAEFLDGIRGRRKALLYVGEGIDYNVYDAISYSQQGISSFSKSDASLVRDAIRDAIGAAQRSNVAIYAVDARGLQSGSEDIIEMMGNFPENTTMGLDTRAFQNELRLSQDSLRTLAEQTGGFASVNSNDFGTAFNRVVRDNSDYYVLGYYPADERRDGRFHKIEVKVNRPGLRVRARKGYVAPKGKAAVEPKKDDISPELRNALNSPLPLPGLPISVTMAAFKGTAPNASVALAVHVIADHFKFTEKNGIYDDLLEMSFWAIDQSGKLKAGDRHQINMTLKPDTLKRVLQFGFRVVTAVDLPPGRYSVRVAARESGGQVGSVVYDLEVPDFVKTPIVMSSIAITTASAGLAPTARPKVDPLQNVMAGPPTTFRAFVPQDEMAAYTEVYDNTGGQPHKVAITAEVKDESGATVFQSREDRGSEELQGGRGGFGFAVRVPLKDFKPGLYVLRIAAVSSRSATMATDREIPFRVVGGSVGAAGK